MATLHDILNKINELKQELEQCKPLLQNEHEDALHLIEQSADFVINRLQSEFIGIVTGGELNNIFNSLNTMVSYITNYKSTKNIGYVNNVINQIPTLRNSLAAIPVGTLNNTEVRKLVSECKQAKDINSKAIASFEKEQKLLNDKSAALAEKTAKLLSDATTGILSKEFERKRSTELETYQLNTIGFGVIIVLIIGVLVFGDLIVNWLFNIGAANTLIQICLRFLTRLSITGPLIWWAIVQNKKMNLSKKLAEEYWHKEIVAKTFVGLSDQIDKNTEGDTAKDLRIKLLNLTLDAIAKDPADCIGNHNDSDNPIKAVSQKGLKKVNDILDTAIKAKEAIPS